MIAQAFVGSQWTNPSEWTLVDETLLQGGPHWNLLRYDLENGIYKGIQSAQDLLEKHRNRRMYMIGYVYDMSFEENPLDFQDLDFRYMTLLNGSDMLKHGMMILCVRQSMPIGGKTHTPLLRNRMVISLQDEAREIEMFISERPRIQLLANSSGPMQQHQKERLAKIDEKFTRRETVHGQLDSLRKKASQHVSDLTVKVHEQEKHVSAFENSTLQLMTSCVQTDVNVAPTQKCFECMANGAHHNEACFLYERIQRDERPMWSTTKFKTAWKPQDDSD